MTSRRSLQTFSGRLSRQTQFVPGHVGGRVASAQPVMRRKTVGAFALAPGVLPTAVRTYVGKSVSQTADPTATVALPTPPVGLSSAVLLVGSSGYSGANTPAGWRLVASGSYGVRNTYGGAIDTWALFALDQASGGEAFSYSFQSVGVTQTFYSRAYAVAYFTGGSGGVWGYTLGTFRSGYSDAPLTAPPDGAQAYAQMGIVTGVYSGLTYPSYTEVTANGVGAGAYITPDSAPYSVMPYETPPSGTIDWNGIGAYGMPNSINLVAVLSTS